MPSDAKDAETYKDYVLGTRDKISKTPEWAEAITGVPRETIARIAKEYATQKPSVLYRGYGMQRRAYGEQVVRAGAINVLTSERWTPYAFGNAQHTIMVEVKKV